MSLSRVRKFRGALPGENVQSSSSRECPQLPVTRLTPALLLSIVLWALLIGVAHLTWRLVG